MTRHKIAVETPIERIFRKVMHRRMTEAERRSFFRKSKVKP